MTTDMQEVDDAFATFSEPLTGDVPECAWLARCHGLATWATIFTLIGAVCFFVGTYLVWPEMAAEEASESQ